MRIKTSLWVLTLLSLVSCAEKSGEDQIKEWISENAIPIKTVEPGSAFDDIKLLKDIVRDARIVSLGEPTHGNKEVFQLKHRMIEYLVEQMGFNVFALECPFAEAFDVNQYVLEGIGTPEQALAGIYYWIWDTEEIVELLKWMRNYNADPNHTKKIRFYGFDTQDPERAARNMFSYLKKADTVLANKVRPELGALEIGFSNPELVGRRQWVTEEFDSLSLKNIRLVMDSFERNKEQYIDKSSLNEWVIARQHARQVEIWIENYFDEYGVYLGNRDFGQAQNLEWILEQEPPDTRMIVWAHNTHIANDSKDGYKSMGLHMKKWFGDDYKIIGFFFNQGQFSAIDVDNTVNGVRAFSIGAAPEDTFEYHMAKSKNELAMLDLSKLPETGVVHDWFNQEQLTRNSGGGYDIKDPERYFWNYNLAECFDALVFLDSTTAVSYVNDSDFDLFYIKEKLDSPLNTDFEVNKTGEPPSNWVAWSKFERFNVKMTVTDVDAYKGRRSALLQRTAGTKFGEITPSIRQYIDATPYRGKMIRLKVAAKAELAASNLAFVRLSIEPDPLSDAHGGLPSFFDSMDDYQIVSDKWEVYEIEAKVDEKAGVIHYGVYLRDFGTVWLDDVTIEIIE